MLTDKYPDFVQSENTIQPHDGHREIQVVQFGKNGEEFKGHYGEQVVEKLASEIGHCNDNMVSYRPAPVVRVASKEVAYGGNDIDEISYVNHRPLPD